MAEIRNRNLGEIYTPQCVSEMLREQVNSVLPNFERDFLIWDSCWGEGNLTRPLDADDLWCSTLRKQDITANASEKGNKFTYDFLNEDVNILESLQMMWSAEYENLPEHILNVLDKGEFSGPEDDKGILFYINPPYVGTGVFGANNTDFRDGATDCVIKDMMNRDRCGTASTQAYAQFMYRILKMKRMYSNKKIYVALVSPSTFLCTGGYQSFREAWLRDFKFMSGKFFCANTFEGLNNRWGIITTVWGPVEDLGKNSSEDTHNFKFDLMVKKDGKMQKFGEKTLYNIDGQTRGNELAKEEELKSHMVEAPITCSSGAVVSNKKRVLWNENSIGYMFFKGNNIYHNVTEIGLMSVPYGDGSGASITPDNVLDILSLFASKGSVGVYGRTWTNDKDEYLYPNKNCEDWVKLQMNAIVYGLFNDNTHFACLDLENGQKIINHFHYRSVDNTDWYLYETEEKTERTERLGYRLLQQAKESGLLFDSGLKFLEEAEKMYQKCLPYRTKGGEFDRKYPKYQVWQPEAGYYQWKWIMKEYFDVDYKEFRKVYRVFSDDIKELIYRVGFLKNRAVGLNGEYIE